MSITPPKDGWFEAPTGFERTWVGLALVWCLLMFLAMPYWHFKGKQNSTGEAYTVTPEAFLERTNRFVETNKTGEKIGGFDVVEPAPGTDIYLAARMWSFHPAVLKLKKDSSYRLHMSSIDLNHGFSLQPMNMNFQIVPGYDHVLTLTPTVAGEYTVLCNEFCGIGHHMMTSRIIVE
ncbi:MAG: cytochrome c oxidase subunit II [Proteobacteria bacterium]|nr:cytochrome c oxidase subunit II [Pseudomonadota bacterium]